MKYPIPSARHAGTTLSTHVGSPGIRRIVIDRARILPGEESPAPYPVRVRDWSAGLHAHPLRRPGQFV